ncbi:MAG: hypothetical protein KC620_22800 [Myxococcales bacterium]|nr:hypothetical protein [Myxococcales bacterium]
MAIFRIDGAPKTRAVNQVAHGFAVADAIRNSGAGWVKAQADSVSNAGHGWETGLVSAVADVDNFTVRFDGPVTSAAHGFTSGKELFLDPSTAGDLTETEPSASGQVSRVFATVVDGNTLNVGVKTGIEIP